MSEGWGFLVAKTEVSWWPRTEGLWFDPVFIDKDGSNHDPHYLIWRIHIPCGHVPRNVVAHAFLRKPSLSRGVLGHAPTRDRRLNVDQWIQR